MRYQATKPFTCSNRSRYESYLMKIVLSLEVHQFNISKSPRGGIVNTATFALQRKIFMQAEMRFTSAVSVGTW